MKIPQQSLQMEMVELEQESLQPDDYLERKNSFKSSMNK
jgi:hypothetical protein